MVEHLSHHYSAVLFSIVATLSQQNCRFDDSHETTQAIVLSRGKATSSKPVLVTQAGYYLLYTLLGPISFCEEPCLTRLLSCLFLRFFRPGPELLKRPEETKAEKPRELAVPSYFSRSLQSVRTWYKQFTWGDG